jgi:hypothetical protein
METQATDQSCEPQKHYRAQTRRAVTPVYTHCARCELSRANCLWSLRLSWRAASKGNPTLHHALNSGGAIVAYRAGWLKRSNLWLLIMRCHFESRLGHQLFLSEILHDFPRFLQINEGVVLSRFMCVTIDGVWIGEWIY